LFKTIKTLVLVQERNFPQFLFGLHMFSVRDVATRLTTLSIAQIYRLKTIKFKFNVTFILIDIFVK